MFGRKIRPGDKYRDTNTQSEWTVISVNTQDDGIEIVELGRRGAVNFVTMKVFKQNYRKV